MSDISGRAVTSVPASEASTSADIVTDRSDVDHTRRALMEDVFVPHVFDFVSIASNAGNIVRSSIPSLFLEPLAVDQSTIVGNGASFSAFRKVIPSPPTWSETRSLDGLLITTSNPKDDMPKHVVYKVARVAFTDIGQPTAETRQAMKAAMMEIFALVHPPLLKHSNIVDFLGLAWGSNYYDPSHRLPVLVVEYAVHGSLAQLQENETLKPRIRSSLALDTGEGIKVLHRCGIIHGDVKSENVLIFAHPEKKYLAKVADFGFSLVGEAAHAEVHVGGTKPWKAPETKQRLAKQFLKATDVYSYGLLLWRLATDGKDPFRFLPSSELKGDPYLDVLERFKELDGPAKNIAIEKWYLPYIIAEQKDRQADLSPDWLAKMISNLRLLTTMTQAGQATPNKALADIYPMLTDTLRMCILTSQPTDSIGQMLLTWAQKDSFYGRVSTALSKCLSLSPQERDLEATLSALRGNQSTETTTEITIGDEDVLLRTSYNHHVLSWQQMKNLEPAVQSFLFQRFLSKAQQNTLLGLVNPPDCFILASYRINAYGTNFDFKEATRLLLETSKKDYDHWPSRAYSYRICKSLDKSFEATEGLISGLHDSALAGSRTALKDLRELDPEKYAAVKNLLRDVLAGVGANFFYPDQMLGGFTYWQWMNTFNDLGIMVQNLGKINRIVDYKVNQRGDGILHLAASSGKHAALSKLLGSFPALGINHVNDKGETPLLCACRAGQVEAVHKILGLGGDASITTPLGESCLHWLVSFEDAHVEEIARALLKAGANVRQCTRKRIAYSIFPASIEVDYERPGTALAWAVHNDRPHIIKVLLEEARDASICVFWLKDVPESPAPMELAAFSHNIECLKLLVEAMKEAKLGFTIGPFLNAATHSADTFSMVLRDGPKFKEKLNSTLDYLVEESRNVVFGSGIGGFGVNLLYKAVSGAHDHVVEYILSPRMDELLGPFDEKDSESYKGAFHPSDINRPCGSTRRTPLLEAVRWNRKHLVDLLLIHGADPKARARHPFAKDDMNWTALHILANAGHDTDVSLASTLVRSDLDVDGQPEEPLTSPREEFVADQQPLTNVPPTRNDSLETPFLVAIQNNAFTLATELLNLGADINAMSVGSGFITLKQPITVLGHLIAASSQYTTARLRYLLHKCSKHNDVDFIIEPARNLSALHRAAWANTGVCHRSPDEPDGKAVSRDEYDMVVNREILVELLQKWNDAEHLDRRCSVDGKTALHLAVEAGNIEAVRLLLERKADRMLRDGHALTPLEYALELHRDEKWAYSRKEMEAVMALLKQ